MAMVMTMVCFFVVIVAKWYADTLLHIYPISHITAPRIPRAPPMYTAKYSQPSMPCALRSQSQQCCCFKHGRDKAAFGRSSQSGTHASSAVSSFILNGLRVGWLTEKARARETRRARRGRGETQRHSDTATQRHRETQTHNFEGGGGRLTNGGPCMHVHLAVPGEMRGMGYGGEAHACS